MPQPAGQGVLPLATVESPAIQTVVGPSGPPVVLALEVLVSVVLAVLLVSVVLLDVSVLVTLLDAAPPVPTVPPSSVPVAVLVTPPVPVVSVPPAVVVVVAELVDDTPPVTPKPVLVVRVALVPLTVAVVSAAVEEVVTGPPLVSVALEVLALPLLALPVLALVLVTPDVVAPPLVVLKGAADSEPQAKVKLRLSNSAPERRRTLREDVCMAPELPPAGRIGHDL